MADGREPSGRLICIHESSFGLNTDPFRLGTDHRFCVNHPSYLWAKGMVQSALYHAEDFVMIACRPSAGRG